MSMINLLPDDYIQRRVRRRANAVCLVLFAIVMSGVITAAVVSEESSRHTRQVRDSVNASYEEAARLIEQMQQLQSQKQTLTAKAQQAATLQERVPRSYLLGIITNACPEHTSLLSIEMETKRVDTVQSGSKFETMSRQRRGVDSRLVVEMQITGLAATDVEVAMFIANLARSPLLTGVDLVYSQEKIVDNVPAREFQVKMELQGGVDVIDVLGAPRARAATDVPTGVDGERS